MHLTKVMMAHLHLTMAVPQAATMMTTVSLLRARPLLTRQVRSQLLLHLLHLGLELSVRLTTSSAQLQNWLKMLVNNVLRQLS